MSLRARVVLENRSYDSCLLSPSGLRFARSAVARFGACSAGSRSGLSRSVLQAHFVASKMAVERSQHKYRQSTRRSIWRPLLLPILRIGTP